MLQLQPFTQYVASLPQAQMIDTLVVLYRTPAVRWFRDPTWWGVIVQGAAFVAAGIAARYSWRAARASEVQADAAHKKLQALTSQRKGDSMQAAWELAALIEERMPEPSLLHQGAHGLTVALDKLRPFTGPASKPVVDYTNADCTLRVGLAIVPRIYAAAVATGWVDLCKKLDIAARAGMRIALLWGEAASKRRDTTATEVLATREVLNAELAGHEEFLRAEASFRTYLEARDALLDRLYGIGVGADADAPAISGP